MERYPQRTLCLCDSGYVGKEISNKALNKNLKLIVKPKKLRPSKKYKIRKSHILFKNDSQLLKQHRNKIELLIRQIKFFRGLVIKYVKKIDSYKCLLMLACLCISSYNIFVKVQV